MKADIVDASGDSRPEDQLARYAEDFGELFNEYQDIKGKFEGALRDGQRATEIQHALESLLHSMDDVAVIVTDTEGVIRDASPAAADALGVDSRKAVGQPLARFFAESRRATIGELILRAGNAAPAAAPMPLEAALTRMDGKLLDGRVLRVPDAEHGYRLHWLFAGRNEADHDAARRSELVSSLYSHTGNGIMVTDSDGIVLSVNPAFSTITGYLEGEIVGRGPGLLASGRHDAAFYAAMWRELGERGEWQGEIWNRRKNGEIYPQWLHITSVRGADDGVEQYVGMFHDLGSFAAGADRLHEIANHDPLTGLPNRALFKDRLQQAITRARRGDPPFSLMFIDLDRFKMVNDTLGHAVGDQLLVDFSWRLAHAVRDTDFIARLGGDEFAVIASGPVGEDEVAAIAAKIVRAVAEPFVVGEREVYVGASIGIARYPDHSDSGEELLRHADTAMYAAKAAGGNGHQYYDNALGQGRAQRVEMEAALRRALAQGQLRLAYQPQVSAADGRIVGVEALLRWDWPGHGAVAPDQFIPIAEQTGLILTIGEWVLRAACLQLAAWRREGLPPLRMAVNITARQLNDPAFPERVATMLAETGTSPRHLELEITESQLMEKLHVGLGNLARLRALGVAVAVDDFGTGYSSLGRVRSLPIDRLKIDRSFIADLEVNSDSYAIAHAIVAMANALRLEVIAEGVEHPEQAQLLAGIRCHEFQGFLYGRPVAPEGIAELLHRQENPS